MVNRRHVLHLVVVALVLVGLCKNANNSRTKPFEIMKAAETEPNSLGGSVVGLDKKVYPVIDIISVGSMNRPDYQDAQQATFGSHPSVRNFFRITEKDDVDQDCTSKLQWRDVAAISGYCGGLRRLVQNKHRLLYELRIKFAKPEWMQRTKSDPVGWLCAQKRPMAGFRKIMNLYEKMENGTQENSSLNNNNNNNNNPHLPDFLIIMDDDTFYNMEQVSQGLQDIQKEQYQLHGDSGIVVAGCVIRGRLKRFKWTFPFGGWGTIFSQSTLETILQPMHCSATKEESLVEIDNVSSYWNSIFCPKLMKDRIGELQVYRDGMSLLDIMYAYVVREPYANHANWSLGFCLHSDWVWGYMVNYYNISLALGRRKKDLPVDRLGAYNGSEMNPPYSEGVLRLRRQCDFDSDANCSKSAHMCHYISPQHMYYLSGDT